MFGISKAVVVNTEKWRGSRERVVGMGGEEAYPVLELCLLYGAVEHDRLEHEQQHELDSAAVSLVPPIASAFPLRRELCSACSLDCFIPRPRPPTYVTGVKACGAFVS